MAEPLDRRSNRARKPIVHFDEKIALAKHAKPAKAPKSIKSAAKSATKPIKSTQKPKTPTAQPESDNVIEELCNQTQDLDIDSPKEKKRAKAAEVARLTRFTSLQDIIEEAKPLEDVKFEAFDPKEQREPKINIPDTIDLENPLELLDLFLPSEIYLIIATNTNLYATSKNARTEPTPTNRRIWYPTNPSKIHVLFGIFFYIGVHQELNYTIY